MTGAATKRVLSRQIAEAMAEQKITKTVTEGSQFAALVLSS